MQMIPLSPIKLVESLSLRIYSTKHPDLLCSHRGSTSLLLPYHSQFYEESLQETDTLRKRKT